MINKMENKLSELRNQIETDNEKFNAMTPAEKRVVIAQDCLIRLDIGQIRPSMSVFVNRVSLLESIEVETDSKCYSLKQYLNNQMPTCVACAKGSLFLSYVGRVNDVTFGELSGGNSLQDRNHTKLLEIFSVEQLAAIECAFEGMQYIETDLIGNRIRLENIDGLYDFRDNFNNSRERMIGICKNIIENNGTFVW